MPQRAHNPQPPFQQGVLAGAFAEHFEGEGPKVIARVVLAGRQSFRVSTIPLVAGPRANLFPLTATVGCACGDPPVGRTFGLLYLARRTAGDG
jgi:hypothetical protein